MPEEWVEKEWNGGGESEYNVETKVVHGEGGDAGAGMAGDGAEALGGALFGWHVPGQVCCTECPLDLLEPGGGPLVEWHGLCNESKHMFYSIIPQFLATRAKLCRAGENWCNFNVEDWDAEPLWG